MRSRPEPSCHQLESPESRAVPRCAGKAGLGGNGPTEPLPAARKGCHGKEAAHRPTVYFKDSRGGGQVTSRPIVPRVHPLACGVVRLCGREP